MNPEDHEINISFVQTVNEKWLYNALLHGKETADFIASVETDVALLPDEVKE